MSSDDTLKVVVERNSNPEYTTLLFRTNLQLSAVNTLLLADEIYQIGRIKKRTIRGGVTISKFSVRVSYSHVIDEADIELAVIEKIADAFGIEIDEVAYQLSGHVRSREERDRETLFWLNYLDHIQYAE